MKLINVSKSRLNLVDFPNKGKVLTLDPQEKSSSIIPSATIVSRILSNGNIRMIPESESDKATIADYNASAVDYIYSETEESETEVDETEEDETVK